MVSPPHVGDDTSTAGPVGDLLPVAIQGVFADDDLPAGLIVRMR